MDKYLNRFYIWGVVVLVVISASFFFHYYNSNKVHINDIGKRTDLSVELLNEKINDWLNNRAQLIKDAGNYIAIENYGDKELLTYLKQLLENNEEFSSLYFGTPNNQMINASGWEMPKWFDLRERPWYKKAAKNRELIFTEAFINASEDDIIITVAKPVYSQIDGDFLGVIAGDVSIKNIISYVEKQKAVENGFFMLIDSNNHVLAHPDFNYNLEEGIPKLKSHYVKNMNVDQSDNQTRIKIEGKDGYLSYEPVSNTNWILANFTPLEIYTETFNILLRSFLFGLLTSILVVATFLMLQNRYVIKPLRKFDKHIRNIDIENDLNYRIPVNNEQDFKFLSRSINNVLDKAQNYFNELKDKRQSIKFLAYHDPLTELPNRRKFVEKLKAQLTLGNKGVVMLLDLDNFKDINDTMGHSFGDKVLKILSKKLKKMQGDKVFISRFGGDEFLILLKNEVEINKITEYAEMFVSLFREPIVINGKEIFIDCSMGISRYPYDSNDINELIANADTAMYKAKRASKGDFVFFNQNMTEQIKQEKKIKDILREAIKNDGFKLKFQPQINLETGFPDCFEALLRLKDYDISPGEFIPIAEEKGFIIEIGRWVTKEAIKQIAEWKKKGWNRRRISINLSPQQLGDTNYISFLKGLIEENEIEPSLLEIEITESILLENKETSFKFLDKLKQLGVRIALDDFGKGYSSFSYLTFIPADKVKLDKSLNDQFISDENFNTVKSLISLIHSLNLKVVAEGIESQLESQKLREHGCDYIQGYVFSKPLNKEDLRQVYDKKFI